jgi:hypothetical protein
MSRAKLLIEPVPSGNPLLKGYCSECRNVSFVYVGDTAENRRLMRQAYDRHEMEVHLQDHAGQPERP